jgi:hypothetical protein
VLTLVRVTNEAIYRVSAVLFGQQFLAFRSEVMLRMLVADNFALLHVCVFDSSCGEGLRRKDALKGRSAGKCNEFGISKISRLFYSL